MMKRLLVTGATGFIGTYLVPKLAAAGCAVIASSRRAEQAASSSWPASVELRPFDLQDFNDKVDYFQYFGAPDALMHLAWEGLPNYTAPFHLEENLPRHKAFLANLIRNGLQDLTITGTCFEYGMKEGPLSEEMPAEPTNPYAEAKDLLRRYIQDLQQAYGFSFRWVRLFYMYGKGQNPKSLLSQLDQAIARGDRVFNMSGGEQVRDYLPVEEVARNLVKIALQHSVTGIINCCSGRPVTVKQLVQEHLERNKTSIQLNLGYYPYPAYEPMAFWGDNTKLKMIQ